MAQIINLRMARKARARTAAEQKAAENRAKFGRTKAEKATERAKADREARMLDGALRKRDAEDGAGA
ncbi:MAG TPA: DUF4169 family protein [Sphingobium sp.]|nr:DUF4169 family protein [Sphingobium sp.]